MTTNTTWNYAPADLFGPGGADARRCTELDGRARIGPHLFNDAVETPLLQNAHGDSSGVLGAAHLFRPDETI